MKTLVFCQLAGSATAVLEGVDGMDRSSFRGQGVLVRRVGESAGVSRETLPLLRELIVDKAEILK